MTIFDVIEAIEDARQRQVTVRFAYIDLKGVVTIRIVDPARIMGLTFRGWCCHREEYRNFDLRRMKMVEPGPSLNDLHPPLGEPTIVETHE